MVLLILPRFSLGASLGTSSLRRFPRFTTTGVENFPRHFWDFCTGTDENPVSAVGLVVANTGSATSPWITFAHAGAAVLPGDAVNAAPRAYLAWFDTRASGTASAPSTIRYAKPTSGPG